MDDKMGERYQFSEIKALQLQNFGEEVSSSFSGKISYHVTPLFWTNLRFFTRLEIKIKLTLL